MGNSVFARLNPLTVARRITLINTYAILEPTEIAIGTIVINAPITQQADMFDERGRGKDKNRNINETEKNVIQ